MKMDLFNLAEKKSKIRVYWWLDFFKLIYKNKIRAANKE
jgi:hypothetical protein